MGDARPIAAASICLVTVNYEPETTGIAPYATALARTLRDAGARVQVIAGIPHYPEWAVHDSYRGRLRWDEDADGVRLTRFRHTVPRRARFLGRLHMEASFGALALPAVRQSRADALIAVTPALAGLAVAVAGARGRPLGAIVQDLTGNAARQSGTAGSRISSWISDAEYRLLRSADRVGVITPRFADVLVRHGVSHARIRDVANFTHIEPVAATTSQARERLGWRSTPFTVLHTGNMGRKQSLDTVITAARLAAARGAEIEFVLLGHGNQRRELERRATGLRNVRFIDPLGTDQYPYALAAADALLLCEQPGVQEMSLPSKLTSYVAARRPIIASIQTGGITHDIVSRHGAALVAPAGDATALLDAILRIRSDSDLRERLLRGAAVLAEGYDQDAARERYVQFALEVLQSGRLQQPLAPVR
jgi:glycosyltransferase involved in cell wall biosynthesis